MNTSYEPALTMGSMARVMPGFRRGGVPGWPKLGTCGSSCICRPIPWPTDRVAAGVLAVAGDAVHRLVVDGHADRARKPVVAEEAGRGATGADELVGDLVQLDGPRARLAGRRQRRQHRGQQLPSTGHEV